MLVNYFASGTGKDKAGSEMNGVFASDWLTDLEESYKPYLMFIVEEANLSTPAHSLVQFFYLFICRPWVYIPSKISTFP